MTKFKIILLSGCVLLMVIIYFMFLHPYSITGSKNYDNAKNIHAGITKDSMIKIMGKPDKIIKDNFSIYQADSGSVYYYDLGFASADGINVIVDSTNHVKMVIRE